MLNLKQSLLTLFGAVIITAASAETLVVSNTNSTGPGSLANAIVTANADPSPTVITFNIPGSSDHIIYTGGFPVITAPLSIYGSTQPQGKIIIENNAINLPGIDIAFDISNVNPQAYNWFGFDNLTITHFVYGIRTTSSSWFQSYNINYIDNYGIDIKTENSSHPWVPENTFPEMAFP